MKYIIGIIMLLSLLIAGCSTESTEFEVGVTFYPYFDITRAIVGDTGNVMSIVPPTTEPHSFSPSPRDIARLQQLDVYVKTGVEFEAFENTLIQALPSNVVLIDASHGIDLITGYVHDHDHGHDHGHSQEHSEHAHEEEHHHEDEHEHSEHAHENEHHEEHHEHNHEYSEHAHEEEHHHEDEHHEEHHEHSHDMTGVDPHVWLSPRNAIQIAENIKDGLVSAREEYATIFEENAAAFIQELTLLDQEMQTALASCEQNTILVTHNAYQYLARDYGFNTISISGLSPESEPTPQQLVELVNKAEEYNIQYVFFEELVSPRVAQAIAQEIGAETLTINPVAGSQADEGYLAIMRDNLNKLVQALACQ